VLTSLVLQSKIDNLLYIGSFGFTPVTTKAIFDGCYQIARLFNHRFGLGKCQIETSAIIKLYNNYCGFRASTTLYRHIKDEPKLMQHFLRESTNLTFLLENELFRHYLGAVTQQNGRGQVMKSVGRCPKIFDKLRVAQKLL